MVVPIVQIALWALPFPVVHRFVDARRVRAQAGTPAMEIAAAVAGVPHASCLVRVFAGALLLARHGRNATMRLGVTKEGRRVDAHAWLESDGSAILGAPPLGTMIGLE